MTLWKDQIVLICSEWMLLPVCAVYSQLSASWHDARQLWCSCRGRPACLSDGRRSSRPGSSGWRRWLDTAGPDASAPLSDRDTHTHTQRLNNERHLTLLFRRSAATEASFSGQTDRGWPRIHECSLLFLGCRKSLQIEVTKRCRMTMTSWNLAKLLLKPEGRRLVEG